MFRGQNLKNAPTMLQSILNYNPEVTNNKLISVNSCNVIFFRYCGIYVKGQQTFQNPTGGQILKCSVYNTVVYNENGL